MALEDEDSDTIHYVMLRAVNKFLSEYNRYPGSDQHTMEADVPKLKALFPSDLFPSRFSLWPKITPHHFSDENIIV